MSKCFPKLCVAVGFGEIDDFQGDLRFQRRNCGNNIESGPGPVAPVECPKDVGANEPS
jgi:hypothetical protein